MALGDYQSLSGSATAVHYEWVLTEEHSQRALVLPIINQHQAAFDQSSPGKPREDPANEIFSGVKTHRL